MNCLWNNKHTTNNISFGVFRTNTTVDVFPSLQFSFDYINIISQHNKFKYILYLYFIGVCIHFHYSNKMCLMHRKRISIIASY